MAVQDGERQPLLDPSNKSSPQHTATIDDIGTSLLNNDEVIPKAGEDARYNNNRFIVQAAVTLLGLTGLVLLIKHLIDTGDTEFDLKGALKKALGGGLSGAAAMILQVFVFMPLRTIMNYQYRFGTSTTTAATTLYADGGWTRYYQGLSAALLQGPISRFGDTAANAGILALLRSNPVMKRLPAFIQTIFASLAAAAFRIVLTPIDTVKTTLQAQGKPGIAILKARIKRYGLGTLWYGALATAAATFVGHYPWFSTYNYLEDVLPEAHTTFEKLSRRAFIGFVASVVSDTISNSLRVVKTYRQVNDTRIGYVAAARNVIEADGWAGLLGRGLKTRILANGFARPHILSPLAVLP
ncbi:mitochondrial carrier [Coprinellus micaceus]|uniref:Mitochondrial carrier n=1 Tax=Coprinellus micaceus TaxID=71717 RepID=A0A4Y7SSX8_COPMI|nr:mitochondrial carrier [Coprinellus micaceus]